MPVSKCSVVLMAMIFCGLVAEANEPHGSAAKDEAPAKRALDNSSPDGSARDDDDQFVALLNGKELSGWQTTGKWFFDEDNVLTVTPKRGLLRALSFTHFLWTKREYGDFVLDMEYKINEGGNSGVFIRCRPPRSYIEVQITDSNGKQGKLEPGDSGGIVEAVAPSSNQAKPAGQWNRMTITCEETSMQVVLNGEKVVDVDLRETSKKENPLTGYIGLQDYGFPVWFRNLRIKELK